VRRLCEAQPESRASVWALRTKRANVHPGALGRTGRGRSPRDDNLRPDSAQPQTEPRDAVLYDLIHFRRLGWHVDARLGPDLERDVDDFAAHVNCWKNLSNVGDGRDVGLTVSYSFDGDRLLGTAGAIKKALPMLGDSFFVLYGDSYLPCDYRQVQIEYVRLDRPSLMTVYRNEGRWDSSNVELADGQILAYDKKHPNPRMHHIDYGLGVFHRSAFAPVRDQESHDLATLYQELLRTDRLAAFEVSHRFYEIGSPAGLEEMRAHVRGLTLLFEHGQQ